ncbi:MAG: ArnT family glycosyltransferase [Pikeienuella sp.]
MAQVPSPAAQDGGDPRAASGWLGRLQTDLEWGFDRGLAWASSNPWRAALVIGLVALAVILPGISALPVTDRDEARFAQATKQMLETGNFVDIRFQDAPRWKKPAGIYWLQAGAAGLAGGAEAPIWAYRLPSALGVLAAAVLMVWALKPVVGRAAATLAGVMVATCLLAIGEANIAKTDAALLATAVVVLGVLARMALDPPDAPPLAWTVVLAGWGAAGIAVLLKGPIVPAIALLALGALWAAHRKTPRLGRLRPLPGLALMLAIALPWLVAIWMVSGGAFFEESVGRDLIGKVREGQEAHWGPPGLYLLLIWGTMWPWAALLPQAAPWLWAQRREAWLLLLAAWTVPFWVVLEAVPTKLPHYVLPLYPALLAAVAAWALAADKPVAGPRLRWASALLVAVPGFGLALAIPALPLALEGRLLPIGVALGALGAAGTLLAFRAALAARPRAQIAASLCAVVPIAWGALQVGLPALDTVFPSPRIAAAAAPWMPCASGPLVTAGYREPSMVFMTDTATLLATPPEAARVIAEEPGTLMLLEDRWKRFMAAYAPLPDDLVERARLEYFNYNRGDYETAALVTRADPRWDACAR